MDSGSSVSGVGDGFADPDWNAEQDRNENIIEDEYAVDTVSSDTADNIRTENRDVLAYIFDPNNLPVCSLCVPETTSVASAFFDRS